MRFKIKRFESYHINSDKIRRIEFYSKIHHRRPVIEICDAFKNNAYEDALNNTKYFNVKKIKELKIS